MHQTLRADGADAEELGEIHRRGNGEKKSEVSKCSTVQHIAYFPIYGLLGIGKHGKDTAEIFCCRGLDIARCFASQW